MSRQSLAKRAPLGVRAIGSWWFGFGCVPRKVSRPCGASGMTHTAFLGLLPRATVSPMRILLAARWQEAWNRSLSTKVSSAAADGLLDVIGWRRERSCAVTDVR